MPVMIFMTLHGSCMEVCMQHMHGVIPTIVSICVMGRVLQQLCMGTRGSAVNDLHFVSWIYVTFCWKYLAPFVAALPGNIPAHFC